MIKRIFENKVFELTRRNLLRLVLSAPVVSAVPLAGVAIALPASAGQAFSNDEQLHITHMVHDILPEDTDPGAVQTGSAVHTIGYFMSLGAAAVDQIKVAIVGMNMISQAIHGVDFINCTQLQREMVYAVVKDDELLAAFWFNLRAVAVLHFYAHPLGYEQAGLPGPSLDDERFFNADRRSLRLCGDQRGL